jgi:ribosomal 50S subunit-recycling heat shock protein
MLPGENLFMRLDKFLKVSRVIKRRTLAKEVCDSGQVTLNGRPAKAGSEVKSGDIVAINFGSRKIRLEILSVRENVPAKQASELYCMLEEHFEKD